MKAVVDTNILVDYLQGFAAAQDELAHYSAPVISLVTWMEILIGGQTTCRLHPPRKQTTTARRHHLGHGSGTERRPGHPKHPRLPREPSRRPDPVSVVNP